MTKSLPSDPSLVQLKKQAKDILELQRAGDNAACEVLRHHQRFSRQSNSEILQASVTLQETQHALALDYGFDDWQSLRATVSNAPPASPVQIVDTSINLLSHTTEQGDSITGPVLGIDIGSSGIKLVELSRHASKFKVECYGVEPFPESAVMWPVPASEELNADRAIVVAETIARLIARCKTRSDGAVVGVAVPPALTRHMVMPAEVSEGDRRQWILEHPPTDKYVPGDFTLNEALDFQVIGPSPKNPDFMDVRLATCRQQAVDVRQDVLERAGLKTRAVDIEGQCMDRVYRTMMGSLGISDSDVGAVFDVGATMSSLIIVRKPEVFLFGIDYWIGLTRAGGNCPGGGMQLIRDIQQRYKVSSKQAELAVRNGGRGLPDDFGDTVLLPWIEAVMPQAIEPMEIYFELTPFEAVDHLVVCGGAASIPGLVQAFKSKLEIPITLANPFESMDLSSEVDGDQLLVDAPSLMLACGMAMRSFA